jgi:ADP-heptose:LPS heptosyltransferase
MSADPSTLAETSGNVWVIFHKQLGDTVLLQPALHRLALALPRPPVLIAPPRFAPLLQLMSDSCRPPQRQEGRPEWTLAYDSGSTSAWHTLRSRSRRTTIIRFSENGRRWIHSFVYHEIIDAPGGKRYRARYYWENTPVPTQEAFRPPRLQPPPSSWLPHTVTGPYLLAHPGSAWRRKCWTVDAWVCVLDALHRHTGLPWILSGGGTPWEIEHNAQIAALCRAPVLNLSGATTLQGFLALCHGARMVISVDGSASHIASAFGRPTLTLFGPTDPAHWHHPNLLARALRAETRGNDHVSLPLEALPSEVVSDAARALWEVIKDSKPTGL